VIFSDRILVRLGTQATRAAVFDSASLESVVEASYDTSALPVQAPFQAVFDELQLGVAAPQLATANGTWNPVGGVERTESSFTIAGVGADTPRIDALWRGAVVARVVRDLATIESVETTWPEIGTIDADIVSDLGGLPVAPEDLEDERRLRLVQRMRATLDQPARFDDVRLESMLHEAGVESVTDLLERFRGTVVPATATLEFSAAPPAAPTPVALPVTAAVLVRDVGFSVSELLASTRLVRERLAPLSIERPVDPALHRRNAIVGIWIVPVETFDDADWPGAPAGQNAAQRRAARRAAAADWLAGEGIGLVIPPP
jgi:hypothetical protein